MEVGRFVDGSGAFFSMVLVQVFATGLQLFSKIILTQGIFIYALIAYRNVVGALCVAPFVFFFERGEAKKLNWFIGFWLFMNSLTGTIMAMGLFYYGLRDTTTTYATNFLNLIPIATFALATVLRVEKLELGTKAGKMKALGAIVCVAGALTIGLYKGKSFYIGHHSSLHRTVEARVKHNWARGTAFLVCSVLSYAVWFLVQVKLFKLFPHKYWATMFTCVIAAVQASVVGMCLDRKKASWKLGWNLQLVTIVYSGALATAATFCLLSWVVRKKGPTYPSMFNPLSLILVAITGTLFLGEPLTVGSLIGMFFIVLGLYLFLWGKNEELKRMDDKELPKKNIGVVAEVSLVLNSESSNKSTLHSAVVMPTSVSPSDDHHNSDEIVEDANIVKQGV